MAEPVLAYTYRYHGESQVDTAAGAVRLRLAAQSSPNSPS